MAQVEVHFTEYFDGKTVAVSSAGRELLRVEGLRTDMRTNLARIVHIEVNSQSAELTFEVVAAGSKSPSAQPQSAIARATTTVDPSKTKFLVVSFKGEQLRLVAVTAEDYKRAPRGHV